MIENGSAGLAQDRAGYANALLIPCVISADGPYKQEAKQQAIAAFQTAADAHQGDKELKHPESRGRLCPQCETRPSFGKQIRRFLCLKIDKLLQYC